jgi:hypothetical protein
MGIGSPAAGRLGATVNEQILIVNDKASIHEVARTRC